MCQSAVERVLGKLLTDGNFRDRFFHDPAEASFAAGFELSQAELDALSRVPAEEFARLSGSLDDRICRLHVAPHSGDCTSKSGAGDEVEEGDDVEERKDTLKAA